jgi:hypothetical protein
MQTEKVERYLVLFENAVRKQAEVVGRGTALEQARKAGLGVSADGHIVSCVGHPILVLLRLIKYFTAGGSMETLVQCTPLIDELERLQSEREELFT